jgi:biopolymer transport protein ExbD
LASVDIQNGKQPSGIFEVNLTPLIDVSLVLVVILMVAMPMLLQSGIAVRNAGGRGETSAAARTERVEITIVSADSVRVNRTLVARRNLRGALAPILAASQNRLVVLECDDRVPHGTFVAVLDEAKGCGAEQIAVMEK